MEREASRESVQSGIMVDSESTLPGPQGGRQPSQSNPLQAEGLGSLLREVLSRLDLLDAPTQIPPAQVATSVPLVRPHPKSASRPSTQPSGPPSSEPAFSSLGPSLLRSRLGLREVPHPILSLDEDNQLGNLFQGEPPDPFHALSDAEEGLRLVPDAPLQDVSFRSLLEKVANILAFKLESPPEVQSRFVQLLRGCSARSRLQVPLHEIIPIALKDGTTLALCLCLPLLYTCASRSKEIESSGCNGDTAFLEVRVQQVVVEFILNHVDRIFDNRVPSAGENEEIKVVTKSLSLPSGSCSLPMKLVSLEEAQARSLSPSHPARKERRENSLTDTDPATGALYHTVIDLPDTK
nr:PREDICTED: uncharacterized protein LOC106702131 [Latimeria chalumnae]|eukprot:XP_014339753.1 PREDICTED: uncharacterized protein LOC106702131 [Latimeria chalumnae]